MSSDDEGYVHRPGTDESPAAAEPSDEESAAVSAPDGDNVGADAARASTPSGGDTNPDGFGARGWVLVVVLAVCTLVVPGIIYLSPGILSAIGIPYIASLLVLPLLPAAVLGITAVWAMTAATHGDE